MDKSNKNIEKTKYTFTMVIIKDYVDCNIFIFCIGLQQLHL